MGQRKEKVSPDGMVITKQVLYLPSDRTFEPNPTTMSKTDPKTPKKPPYSAKNEIARLWTQSKMQRETNKIHRERLEKQMSALHDRLTALESRSAPAEEWPKVGDWVVVTGPAGIMGTDTFRGKVGRIKRFETVHSVSAWYIPEVDAWFDIANIRPATPAEIASHKAKEEQRAKEAEWAKYDVLQEGDACLTDKDQFAELVNLAKPLDCILEPHWGSALIEYRKERDWRHGYKPTPGQNLLPFAEFLRRLQGTIAKLREEERANEMAKVPEFGTRVKCHDKEWNVACYGPDPRHGNRYMLVRRDDKDGGISTWPTRDQFTILD